MRCPRLVIVLAIVVSLPLGACEEGQALGQWRQLDPFGTRAHGLQQRLAGCYDLIAWREHRTANDPASSPGVLAFTPPRHFVLSAVTGSRTGEFRLEPQGALARASWSAVLPDSALLEWIEPAPRGPPNGGIQASVALRHDTLVGRAERLTDAPSGYDAYAELVATRSASCPVATP
jgi:hypothetical protein